MEEKSHGEKIDLVRENGESTGRVSGHGYIEVRVIQLHLTTRETQNYLDFQCKRKLKRTFLGLKQRTSQLRTNDWVITIKRHFNI